MIINNTGLSAQCRRYGANMLLNVGSMANGRLRTIDAGVLELIGQWVSYHEEAIRAPRPTDIQIAGKPDDFVLQNGNTYYLFCTDLPMAGSPDVALISEGYYKDVFAFDREVSSITWLDNKEPVEFEQKDGVLTVNTVPFIYGRSLVVRVAKIEVR